MTDKRKGSKADAAYRKEVEALTRAAAEKAKLMQAAAEATPTAQEIQAAQQAQEAIAHAPTPQQVQEAQAAQEAYTAAMGGNDDAATVAQREEIAQRLARLPLSRLSLLPKEQQALVWEYLARQIVDMPGFNDALISLAEAERRAAAEFAEIAPALSETLQKTLDAVHSTLEALQPKLQAAQRSLETMKQANITDDLRQAMRLLGTLAPYMDAEAEEHPELYDENTPASALVAAAARRARADGKDIPRLSAEQADAEQLIMQLDLPTEGTAKEGNQQPAESPRSKRTGAEATGALTTIGQRLLVPSDPEFQNAFVSKVNSDIGIFVIEKLTDIQLRNDGLELSFLENGISDILDANKRTGARPLQDADTGLLRAMAKGAYITRIRSDSMTTSFYLPAFCEELGIEGTHDKGAENRAEARKRQVLDWIDSMGSVWGKLPNRSQWWKVFSVIGYDPKTEIVTVAMPYFNQLLAEIERKQQRQLDAGKKYYIGYCDLLHANAANERNQAAVELATRVLIGVQQRGGIPDKKLKQNKYKAIRSETLCTWKITCAGLIAECPQMQDKLNAQPTTNGKNNMMRRAFTSMYKILHTKSDLFTYYKDVKITEVIPTTRTRTAEIIVTHHGLNPDYKHPTVNLEPAPEEQTDQEESEAQPN